LGHFWDNAIRLGQNGGDKMASILKRGPYQWQVKIRRRGWPNQTKTFETEEDAKKWARLIECEMDRGLFVSRTEAEKTTIKEALERYRKEGYFQQKGRRTGILSH